VTRKIEGNGLRGILKSGLCVKLSDCDDVTAVCWFVVNFQTQESSGYARFYFHSVPGLPAWYDVLAMTSLPSTAERSILHNGWAAWPALKRALNISTREM